MEKTNLYRVDEFGVKNYNYGILGLLSFAVFSVLNLSLGYIAYLAEITVETSPVQNYADALWLMMMSSTTIGFGDVYPVTLIGRAAVFVMFILGVGILGGVGAIFANKIFGFADTNIKNRELRKQNEDIFQQNAEIYKKLAELEKKLESIK
ncbi:two pore domain potassium channel family protein [Litorilituus lipolyticus]|uniref:Two pore domain potassium channel family protein n=2 Tax=Litorilituus lipolyticus TaxID=2491017 RepID=A0A502L4V6_9GAMM|nr:two pore domain potassium channel family protein [Litorilituus lipolyticus]